MSHYKKVASWLDNVIRGQECIVPEFGVGRVTDFGHEAHLGGADYIAVRFYADPTHPQIRRFVPEAVNLIDPVNARTYKARAEVKPRVKNKYAEPVRPKSTPIQSQSFRRTGRRIGPLTTHDHD